MDGMSMEVREEKLDLRDTDDEPFLAVALAASADYLVTENIRDFSIREAPRLRRRYAG
jgi:predicted nucleic acid-binding protein